LVPSLAVALTVTVVTVERLTVHVLPAELEQPPHVICGVPAMFEQLIVTTLFVPMATVEPSGERLQLAEGPAPPLVLQVTTLLVIEKLSHASTDSVNVAADALMPRARPHAADAAHSKVRIPIMSLSLSFPRLTRNALADAFLSREYSMARDEICCTVRR
jgi:hypothetical protein